MALAYCWCCLACHHMVLTGNQLRNQAGWLQLDMTSDGWVLRIGYPTALELTQKQYG